MKASDANFDTHLTFDSLVLRESCTITICYSLPMSDCFATYILGVTLLFFLGLVTITSHNCSVTYLCTATGLSLWLVSRNIN